MSTHEPIFTLEYPPGQPHVISMGILLDDQVTGVTYGGKVFENHPIFGWIWHDDEYLSPGCTICFPDPPAGKLEDPDD